MTAFQDVVEAIGLLERIIRLSFENSWNVHSAVGGKYGELLVAKELWDHEPQMGKKRKALGADIFLSKTQKRIEVKWGMLHWNADDHYFKDRGEIPFWGWGFSAGRQFLKDRFDYCVLLAARKDDATPDGGHTFVLTPKEMRREMKSRVSGEGGRKKKTYFIENSDDPNFFEARRRSMKSKFGIELRKLKIEESLLDRDKHAARWAELVKSGELKSE